MAPSPLDATLKADPSGPAKHGCGHSNARGRHAPANPLWGAPRLHGELLKLGIDIGESRVSKYMVRRRTPHRRHGAGSWKTTSETCRCGFLHRADDPFPGPVCLPGARP